MATTFHLFPHLPWELRARIWELTVEPRTVKIEFTRKKTSIIEYVYPQPIQVRVQPERFQEGVPIPKNRWSRHLRSPIPVPAPIQTCREARNLGLYKKAFSELEILPEGGESRYVWLNLEVDMINVGTTLLPGLFQPVASLIQRLKFEYNALGWMYEEVLLYAFKNLREVHVVCEDGFYHWAMNGCWSVSHWPCGKENVLFSEPGNDRTITGLELEEETWERRERPYDY